MVRQGIGITVGGDAYLHSFLAAEQTMAMPALKRRYTAAEVRRLIENTPGHWPRYELIDGELLVTPAPVPRHQRALSWLFLVLGPYVVREHIGEILWSPADLELEPEQITQPDIFVVPAGDVGPSWTDVHGLVLAIDALSPSTAKNNHEIKRPYYQRVDVPEYWLVDLDAQQIERWRPGAVEPEVLTDSLVWHPRGASSALTIFLGEMWDLLG